MTDQDAQKNANLVAKADVIILGAGASGLMCAMTAARRGKRVLIIEHAEKAGKKLAVTGGGKCNLTNKTVTPADYVGENTAFCRSALARLTPEAVMALAEASGIMLEEREYGQIFCTRSAKDVVNMLTGSCREAGCTIIFNEKVRRVEALAHNEAGNNSGTGGNARADHGSSRFRVSTSAGEYVGASVVVATGGKAWPQVGATGTGYEIARSFGHQVTAIRPALSGLRMPENWPLAHLSGISLPASIFVASASASGGGIHAAKALPLLFTHGGISGPAALQASLYWMNGATLCIDFLPGKDALAIMNDAGKALCGNLFKKHLPDRLCEALLPHGPAMRKAAELGKKDRALIADALHRHTVEPTGSEGFSKAEVSAGGVNTAQISSRTMESALHPGLYFCGEVLDVTGRLGGYNLHWAFASGKVAGENV